MDERNAETLKGLTGAALESAVAVQEAYLRLSRGVFESNAKLLRAQAGIRADFNHRALETLAEQARENREAFLALSQRSAEAHDDFLGSLYSYHQELSKAEEPGREG